MDHNITSISWFYSNTEEGSPDKILLKKKRSKHQIKEMIFDSTRFKLKYVLGSGSFGVVTYAEYTDEATQVVTSYALKSLSKAAVVETGNPTWLAERLSVCVWERGCEREREQGERERERDNKRYRWSKVVTYSADGHTNSRSSVRDVAHQHLP
jgi:hypothetical protein